MSKLDGKKPLFWETSKILLKILAPLRTPIREYQRHDHYIFWPKYLRNGLTAAINTHLPKFLSSWIIFESLDLTDPPVSLQEKPGSGNSFSTWSWWPRSHSFLQIKTEVEHPPVQGAKTTAALCGSAGWFSFKALSLPKNNKTKTKPNKTPGSNSAALEQLHDTTAVELLSV